MSGSCGIDVWSQGFLLNTLTERVCLQLKEPVLGKAAHSGCLCRDSCEVVHTQKNGGSWPVYLELFSLHSYNGCAVIRPYPAVIRAAQSVTRAAQKCLRDMQTGCQGNVIAGHTAGASGNWGESWCCLPLEMVRWMWIADGRTMDDYVDKIRQSINQYDNYSLCWVEQDDSTACTYFLAAIRLS